MSTNAPQTLSVKRKRTEAPVDALVIEHNDKVDDRRPKNGALPSSLKLAPPQKKRKLGSDSQTPDQDAAQPMETSEKRVKGHSRNGTVIWRRIQVPLASDPRTTTSLPPETPTRRFHVSHTDGGRILIERRHGELGEGTTQNGKGASINAPGHAPIQSERINSPPRKRPGTRSAMKPKDLQTPTKPPPPTRLGPSEETIRQFEQFSEQVETEEAARLAGIPLQRSPMKFKPHVPKLRYKERVAQGKAKDPDSMDIDTEEYVYDTYVREIVMPDADGNIPEPEGIVGFIVLAEEDEEWWFGEDESDKEFDTDDEDENAEDYYANDYPEDEMSSEDEFDRGAYNYFHGASDEEYDLDDEAGDDDDKHFRAVAPKTRPGYWGGLADKD